MNAIQSTLMNAEQFFEWAQRPKNAGKHYELDRGRAVEVSRGGERHGAVCVNVGYVLASYIRQRRKGYACGNDTGNLWERDPDTVRGPDVVFYDENRAFRDLNPRYSDDPPTLAVEVLSPNDRMPAVNRRIAQFLRWGVKLVWLVDPEDRSVAVYNAGRPLEVFDCTQELTGSGVLADFRCPVAEFFYAAGDSPT